MQLMPLEKLIALEP